jgi:hypothetical protein
VSEREWASLSLRLVPLSLSLLHPARHSGKRKQAAAERRALARAYGRRGGRRAAAAGGPGSGERALRGRAAQARLQAGAAGAAQGGSAWLQAAQLALAACGCGADALDVGGPGQAAMTEEERKAASGPGEPKAPARPSMAVAAMPVRGRNGGGASAGAV